MSGPTREETPEAVTRIAAIACHCLGCQSMLYPHDTLNGSQTACYRPEYVSRLMAATTPLLRARHVREAVEGLPRPMQPAATDYVSVGGYMVPRAALLAALTGEGM